MRTITSGQNQEIKDVSKLKEKKERDKTGLFLAENVKVIATLLQSKIVLKQVYALERFFDLLKSLEIKEEKITLVTEKVIQKLSSSTTASGIIGVFHKPCSLDKSLISSYGNGLVLAQISDPGNMGTLIRTAAALDLKTVVIVEGVDPWNPKVIQSSAGTIGQVNIFEISWQELLTNKREYKLIALVVSGGETIETLTENKYLFVVGNESTGIPQDWQKDCEELVTLPMPGKTESLNAAISGSIALYLFYLNKKYKKMDQS